MMDLSSSQRQELGTDYWEAVTRLTSCEDEYSSLTRKPVSLNVTQFLRIEIREFEKMVKCKNSHHHVFQCTGKNNH